MGRFIYERPGTIEECLKSLKEPGVKKLIAGGTDILVELRAGKEPELEYLLDVSQIKELKGITEAGNKISIKPGTTHSAIGKSALVKEGLKILAEASDTVGSPQIRNAGTLGGSIVTASPASDPTPALIVANGIVTLQSADRGTRHVLIEDFLTKPYKTSMEKDEMLVDITVDNLKEYKMAFVKLGRRKALAIARMNVAVALKLDGEGKVTDARIVPGSAFPVAKRIKAAEDMLLNRIPTEELIEEASNQVAVEMIKVTGIRWSTEYKEPVIKALVKRALKKALEVK